LRHNLAAQRLLTHGHGHLEIQQQEVENFVHPEKEFFIRGIIQSNEIVEVHYTKVFSSSTLMFDSSSISTTCAWPKRAAAFSGDHPS
jgi:hypothetical protein